MANEGKQFEKDWQDSCPPHIYLMRVKDSAMWGKGQQQTITSKNPCDFIMFRMPFEFLLEMKSTKGTSFSFDEKIIKQNQLDRLEEASKKDGVISGLVFNFRETPKRKNSVYFVHIKDFLAFKEFCGKQSINEKDCQDIGIEIYGSKKKVHHRYDIEDFVQRVIVYYLNRGVISMISLQRLLEWLSVVVNFKEETV